MFESSRNAHVVKCAAKPTATFAYVWVCESCKVIWHIILRESARPCENDTKWISQWRWFYQPLAQPICWVWTWLSLPRTYVYPNAIKLHRMRLGYFVQMSEIAQRQIWKTRQPALAHYRLYVEIPAYRCQLPLTAFAHSHKHILTQGASSAPKRHLAHRRSRRRRRALIPHSLSANIYQICAKCRQNSRRAQFEMHVMRDTMPMATMKMWKVLHVHTHT